MVRKRKEEDIDAVIAAENKANAGKVSRDQGGSLFGAYLLASALTVLASSSLFLVGVLPEELPQAEYRLAYILVALITGYILSKIYPIVALRQVNLAAKLARAGKGGKDSSKKAIAYALWSVNAFYIAAVLALALGFLKHQNMAIIYCGSHIIAAGVTFLFNVIEV